MGFLAMLLLPKCSTIRKYGPCPPARDWGSRVSGLVFFCHLSFSFHNRLPYIPILQVILQTDLPSLFFSFHSFYLTADTILFLRFPFIPFISVPFLLFDCRLLDRIPFLLPCFYPIHLPSILYFWLLVVTNNLSDGFLFVCYPFHSFYLISDCQTEVFSFLTISLLFFLLDFRLSDRKIFHFLWVWNRSYPFYSLYLTWDC